jgi:hypothetical protein
MTDDFLRGKLVQKLSDAERLIREVQVNPQVTDAFSESCSIAIDETHELYHKVLYDENWEDEHARN